MVRKKVVELIESSDPKTKRWRSTFAAGRLAYETGEFRQAESLLARALELAQDLPESGFAIVTTEVGSAAVLLAQRRTREAEARLTRSISALESLGDRAHKELLSVTLRFHAQALADVGDERAAEKELERSASILQELGPEACVQLAYTLSDLCALYLAQGRYSEAETCITKVMKIASVAFGTGSPEYVRADMIYETCRPMDETTRLEMAADGIQKMEYAYGGSHPNISRALERYFKVLAERGDQEKFRDAAARFGVKFTTIR